MSARPRGGQGWRGQEKQKGKRSGVGCGPGVSAHAPLNVGLRAGRSRGAESRPRPSFPCSHQWRLGLRGRDSTCFTEPRPWPGASTTADTSPPPPLRAGRWLSGFPAPLSHTPWPRPLSQPPCLCARNSPPQAGAAALPPAPETGLWGPAEACRREDQESEDGWGGGKHPSRRGAALPLSFSQVPAQSREGLTWREPRVLHPKPEHSAVVLGWQGLSWARRPGG